MCHRHDDFTLVFLRILAQYKHDPENPSSESATYQLAWQYIQFYTNSATEFAACALPSMSMGDWTRNYNGGTYWSMSFGSPQTGAVTTPYQWWFVGARNISYMYDKALAGGAWHYAGVAKIIPTRILCLWLTSMVKCHIQTRLAKTQLLFMTMERPSI